MCKLLAVYVRYKLGQGLVYDSKDGKWVASPSVPNDVVVEMSASSQPSLATGLAGAPAPQQACQEQVICPGCGKTANAGIKFCPGCGHAQPSAEEKEHWNCIECAQTFGSESALHQHNRAKHGNGPNTGGTGEQSTESDLLRRGDPRFRTMHLWFMLKFCFFPLILVFAFICSGGGGEFCLTLHIDAYICTHTCTFMVCTRYILYVDVYEGIDTT